MSDLAPTVKLSKPGRDTDATPVEEFFVEARADDDYAVKNLQLVYSVNGGAEKTVPLFDGARPTNEVTAGHTFYMEELGVKAGDSVSYYARATDNDAVSGAKQTSSDIYFLRIRPFDKNFKPATSMSGGGAAAGAADRKSARSRSSSARSSPARSTSSAIARTMTAGEVPRGHGGADAGAEQAARSGQRPGRAHEQPPRGVRIRRSRRSPSCCRRQRSR